MTRPTAGELDVNGMRMHFETTGGGPPLVLLHGYAGSHADWASFTPAWSERFTLIMPDLRGHGRSTNPARQFTHRLAAQDVLALLRRLGIERYRAVGFSTGGKALLHMALSQPERLEAMVIVSATPAFPAQARTLFRRFTLERQSEAELERLRRTHMHGEEQVQALFEFGRGFADSRTDMNLTSHDLARITADTLIVHGDQDPFYPVRVATTMYSAIPKSYLWVVPNGGHLPVLGEQAAAFTVGAGSFLAGEWRRLSTRTHPAR